MGWATYRLALDRRNLQVAVLSKIRKWLADIIYGRSDSTITFAGLCHLLERGGPPYPLNID